MWATRSIDHVPFVMRAGTFSKKSGVFLGDNPGKPPLGLSTQPNSWTPSLGMWRLSQHGWAMVIVGPLMDAMLHDVCVHTPSPYLKSAAMFVGFGQPSMTVDVMVKPVGVCTKLVLAGRPLEMGTR